MWPGELRWYYHRGVVMGQIRDPSIQADSIIPRLEVEIHMVDAILLVFFSQPFRFLTMLQVVVVLRCSILISSTIVHHCFRDSRVVSPNNRGLIFLVATRSRLQGISLDHRVDLSIRVPIPWFRHQLFHIPLSQLGVGVEVLEEKVRVLEVELSPLDVEDSQLQAIPEM